jgi:hypothetical protein
MTHICYDGRDMLQQMKAVGFRFLFFFFFFKSNKGKSEVFGKSTQTKY